MSVGSRAAAAAATLLVSCNVCLAQGHVRTDIRAVATDVQFQRAVRDNVRHIVVTDHIDMFASQTELEGQGESLDTAVVVVKSETKSIVVRYCLCTPVLFPATLQIMVSAPVLLHLIPHTRPACAQPCGATQSRADARVHHLRV